MDYILFEMDRPGGPLRPVNGIEPPTIGRLIREAKRLVRGCSRYAAIVNQVDVDGTTSSVFVETSQHGRRVNHIRELAGRTNHEWD